MHTWIRNSSWIGIGIASVTQLAACSYDPPSIDNSQGGSGGSITSGTGGMNNGSEGDCLDGLDGDDDKLIDCADPDCNAGYECVEEAPTGFANLTRIITQLASAPPPQCPDGSAAIFHGIKPSTAECTGCKCNVEVMCSTPVINLHASSDCSGSPQVIDPIGNCAKIPNSGSGLSVKVTVDSPTGVCTPLATSITPINPWSEVLYACPGFTTKGGGCGEAQLCVPRSPQPFLNSMCVETMDDVACNGTYGRKVLTYDTFADKRACSQCTCGKSQFVCNGYAMELDSTGTCAGGNGTFMAFPPCAPLDGSTNSIKFTTPTPMVTASECNGGAPSGTVETHNPRTFCCTQ